MASEWERSKQRTKIAKILEAINKWERKRDLAAMVDCHKYEERGTSFPTPQKDDGDPCLKERLGWLEHDCRTLQYGAPSDDFGDYERRRVGVEWIGLRQYDSDRIIWAAEDSDSGHISMGTVQNHKEKVVTRGDKTYTIV